MVLSSLSGTGQASFLDVLQECIPLSSRKSKDTAVSLGEQCGRSWDMEAVEEGIQGPTYSVPGGVRT